MLRRSKKLSHITPLELYEALFQFTERISAVLGLVVYLSIVRFLGFTLMISGQSIVFIDVMRAWGVGRGSVGLVHVMDRHLEGGSREGLGHVASVTSVCGGCDRRVFLQGCQSGCVSVSSYGHVARTIKAGSRGSSRDPRDAMSHGVHWSDGTTLKKEGKMRIYIKQLHFCATGLPVTSTILTHINRTCFRNLALKMFHIISIMHINRVLDKPGWL